MVARSEVFRAVDDRTHRALWQDLGTACLDAVWRQRWRERDVQPGWIEARWKADEDLDAVVPPDDEGRAAFGQVDWITVEDHTNTSASGTIDRYQHLTVWCGRGLITATIRHDDALDLDATAVRVALAGYRRLWQLDR